MNSDDIRLRIEFYITKPGLPLKATEFYTIEFSMPTVELYKVISPLSALFDKNRESMNVIGSYYSVFLTDFANKILPSVA